VCSNARTASNQTAAHWHALVCKQRGVERGNSCSTPARPT